MEIYSLDSLTPRKELFLYFPHVSTLCHGPHVQSSWYALGLLSPYRGVSSCLLSVEDITGACVQPYSRIGAQTLTSKRMLAVYVRMVEVGGSKEGGRTGDMWLPESQSRARSAIESPYSGLGI